MSREIGFPNMKNGVTPATFASEDRTQFVVPLYQRLFVWEDEQIEQLLHDLWDAFKVDVSKPYYIGILTVRTPTSDRDATDTWELVDGQQRITVLTFLGIALACSDSESEWRKFLLRTPRSCDARLRYFARPSDQDDLTKLINCKEADSLLEAKISNPNFRRFFAAFHRFRLSSLKDNAVAFSNFVFRNTTALVSFLPETFGINEPSLYFEQMNSAGRQLEPHEILKVRYFGNASPVWNSVLNGSERFVDPESKTDTDLTAPLTLATLLAEDGSAFGKEPAEEARQPNPTRSILSIPAFLLHVLDLCIGNTKCIPGFWDSKNLLATFKCGMETLACEKFVATMKAYRKWLDEWIIHIEDDDTQPPFCINDKSRQRDDSSKDVRPLWQFQSMLRASSDDNQKWVLEAYSAYGEKVAGAEVTAVAFLDMLKLQDNKRHSFSMTEATTWEYPGIDRYWFWKLDYILWEQCVNGQRHVFDEAMCAAIQYFRFRRNRSIEHLHPQNPEHQEGESWKKCYLHSFGNLAMISASFNSSQGNDTVGTKFGRTRDRIDRRDIESIKLLLMFSAANGKDIDWTPDAAENHGDEMLQALNKYYTAVQPSRVAN